MSTNGASLHSYYTYLRNGGHLDPPLTIDEAEIEVQRGQFDVVWMDTNYKTITHLSPSGCHSLMCTLDLRALKYKNHEAAYENSFNCVA